METGFSDMEAVSIMPLSVPDKSLKLFLRMLVSALSQGCNLKAWIPPGVPHRHLQKNDSRCVLLLCKCSFWEGAKNLMFLGPPSCPGFGVDMAVRTFSRTECFRTNAKVYQDDGYVSCQNSLARALALAAVLALVPARFLHR